MSNLYFITQAQALESGFKSWGFKNHVTKRSSHLYHCKYHFNFIVIRKQSRSSTLQLLQDCQERFWLISGSKEAISVERGRKKLCGQRAALRKENARRGRCLEVDLTVRKWISSHPLLMLSKHSEYHQNQNVNMTFLLLEEGEGNFPIINCTFECNRSK